MSTLPLGLWLLQLAADFTELCLVWLVQSTLILLVALAAGRMLAGRGPALASAIYRTALVAVVACPLATWLLSASIVPLGLRLPGINVIEIGENEAASGSEGEPAATASEVAALSAMGGASDRERTRDTYPREAIEQDRAVDATFATAPREVMASDPPQVSVNADRGTAVAASSATDASRDVTPWRARTITAVSVVSLALTWLCASLLLLYRLLAGIRQTASLVRHAVAAEPDEQRLCREMARALGAHAPKVARTAFVDSPCLVGIIRPTILLPVEQLDVPLDAVLVHELAHLRRRDHLWNLAARMALCVLFFQPLLWRLVRRLEIAAEEVCDDHVLNLGADRTRYANGLVALAEQSSLPMADVGVPLVTLRSLLARRVLRILDPDSSRALRIGNLALCSLLAFGVAAAVLSGFVSATSDTGTAVSADEADEPPNAPRTANRAVESDPLPEGAIARLGTTRFRPGEGTQAASLLPDKQTVVVSKSDGKLQYWNAQSGQFLREVVFARPHVSAAAHTQDGHFVAARGWSREGNPQKSASWVALIDAQTGREMLRHELNDRRGGRHVVVAENGSAIAVDGDNVTIVDVGAGEVVDWPLDKLGATALALSADGNLLAVGSDGVVRVWRWRESREPRSFTITRKDPRSQPHINSVGFSPDGTLLAIGDHVDGVSLIDLRTGKEIHHLSVEGVDDWRGHHPTFSPDGTLLATPIMPYNGGGVALWDVQTGKFAKRLEMPYDAVRNVTFSADGRFLAGIPWDSMLCVWNVATGELAGDDLAGHQRPPNTMRFFPGDERLVSAGEDSTVHIWNLKSARLERVMKHEADGGHHRMIRGMDVSPDGKYVASSCLDNTVRVWETDTGREVYNLPGHGKLGGIRSVRFTADSQRLASWGDDMRVNVWDVRTGKAINEYRAQPSGEKLPDESDIGKPWFGRGGEVFQLDSGLISPDVSRLLVLGRHLHLFDLATGRESARFDRRDRNYLSPVAISPDNQFVLLLGWSYGDEIPTADGKTTRLPIQRIELRRLSSGELIAEMDRGEGAWPAAAAISRDGRRAAITVNKEGPSIVVVKVPELTEIQRIDGLRASPRALEFSHSAKLLAVSNGDSTVVVYDLDKQGAAGQPNRPPGQQQRRQAKTATEPPRTVKATVEESLPADAVARLGTTRFRPTQPALGVSFLADSRTLAQTTGAGHIDYWDAESGRLLRSVPLSAARVAAAHHSSNGRFIALRGFTMSKEQQIQSPSVKLVDPADGKELMSMDAAAMRGEKIAVSADGSTIAVDNLAMLSIIDTATKAEVRRHRLDHQAHSLALSPDAKTVAVGTRGNLLVWKWSSGEEPKSVPIGASPRQPVTVLALAFSPDGAYLAAGGQDLDGIALLDANTGMEKRRFGIAGVKYWYPRSLAFSADGSLLATPLDRQAGGGVAVWNVASGKLLHRLDVPHEDVSDVVFSPDGRLLAGTNSWERQMCVWNLATGKRLEPELPGHAASPSALRFLPGDGRLVSAGPDGTIRVWNVDQSQQERAVAHEHDPTGYHRRAIRAMDVSADGKLIASSSADDTVRVWETDTGKERYRLPGHGRYGGNRSVRFTPDDQRLVSWGDNMQVYAWDVATGEAVNEFRATVSDKAEFATYGNLEVLGGLVSRDASRLLLLRNDFHIIDVANGKETGRLERAQRGHTRFAISPDNQYVIAFSARQGRELPAQGRRLAATHEWTPLVQLHKVTDGQLVAEKELSEIGQQLAAFSPDGRQAAITSGHANPQVLIVSVPELKEIARIDSLRGPASAVEFSRTGKRLAVSDADTTVLVYDLEKLPVHNQR